MKYLPSILWTLISARGLWTWRRNAVESAKNVEALKAANGSDELPLLFAKADQLMDNLRAFAFLNGLILGLVSFLVIHKVSFTQTPLFLRLYSDYSLTVLIGAFFLFMLNGEIYAYVMDKVQRRR